MRFLTQGGVIDHVLTRTYRRREGGMEEEEEEEGESEGERGGL